MRSLNHSAMHNLQPPRWLIIDSGVDPGRPSHCRLVERRENKLRDIENHNIVSVRACFCQETLSRVSLALS